MSIATSTYSPVEQPNTEARWPSGYTEAEVTSHAKALHMGYAYAAVPDTASEHNEAASWIKIQLRFLSVPAVAYGLFRYVEQLSDTSIRFAGQNGCYDGLPASIQGNGFPQSDLTPDGFPRMALKDGWLTVSEPQS